MKKILQFFVFFIFSISLQSQTTFQKTYGTASTDEIGYDVKTTADGGALLLNNVSVDDSESFDLQLLKVDSEGNIMWEKNYPTQNSESSLQLEEHPSGDYIICANVLKLDGERAVLLKRVKSDSGEEAWSNHYTFYEGIKVDFTIKENGDVVLLMDREDVFVVLGEFGGVKQESEVLSSEFLRSLTSIESTQDGGFILAGTAGFGAFGENMVLLKIDSQGNEEWASVFESTLEGEVLQGGYAFETESGDYVIAGHALDAYDVLVKTNSGGEMVWRNEKNFNDIFGSSTIWNGFEATGGRLVFASSTVGDGYMVSIDDSSGETIWNRFIDYGRLDFLYSVDEQENGNIWAIGRSNSFNGTGSDILLTVHDSEGNELWNKVYGVDGAANEERGVNVTVTPDGDYLIAGATRAYSDDGDLDWYLLSIDGETEEVEWEKTYNYGELTNLAYEVVPIASGGYALYGDSGIEDIPTVSSVMRLTKVDEVGETVWTQAYESLLGGFNFGITTTQDGGFGITGRKSLESGFISYMKLDNEGNIEWTKEYEGATVYNIKEVSDGGFFLNGRGNPEFTPAGDLYLPAQAVKTDNLGDIEWTYGVEDTTGYINRFIGSTEVSDGGYVLTGYKIYGFFEEFYMHIARLDADGNLLWKRDIGDASDETSGYDVIETVDGDFVFLGYNSPMDVNRNRVGMLLKTDKDGNEIWRRFYGSELGTGAVLYDIESTEDGGFILSGTIINKNSTDVCLIKTDSDGIITSINIFNPSLQYNFHIAPNPNNGQFQLSFEGKIGVENLQLSILDLAGRQLEERVIPPISQQVDLSHLPSGTYFIKLGNGQQFSTKRVVID